MIDGHKKRPHEEKERLIVKSTPAAPSVVVPAFVLNAADCPEEVREAFAALDAANEAIAAAYDDYLNAERAEKEADLAIERAVAAGKAPKVEDPRVLKAKIKYAAKATNIAFSEAVRAAARVDAVCAEHRATLRKMIADKLPEAHAHAVEAITAAQNADAAQRALVDAMRSLDLSAAKAYPAGKRRAAESAVVLAYQSAEGKDPSRYLSGRIQHEWSEVATSVSSFPVEEFVADPIEGNGDLADQFERIEQADEARRRVMENRARYAGSRF
jgi:hypothetical protein